MVLNLLVYTEKDLTLEEIGMLSTMINLPQADYTTPEYLASLSTDNIDKVNDILLSLMEKGYILKLDDKYAVNKAIIPQVVRRNGYVGA